MEYAKNVTSDRAASLRSGKLAETKTAPEGAADEEQASVYELAFNTVTARRFCDQHEMSLHTATGRSLP